MAATPPSYSSDLNTDVGKLRLLIPDRPLKRIEDPAVFNDEELNVFLGLQGGNIRLAAADACEVIAMDRAKQAVSVSINSGMSISKTSIPSFFLQRAKSLREANTVLDKTPWEYVDSFNYHINELGEDTSEYVGDED